MSSNFQFINQRNENVFRLAILKIKTNINLSTEYLKLMEKEDSDSPKSRTNQIRFVKSTPILKINKKERKVEQPCTEDICVLYN